MEEKYPVTKAQLLKLCELVAAKKDTDVLLMLKGLTEHQEPIIEARVIPLGAPVTREYGELYGMFGDSKEYVIPEKKPELNTDEIELERYKTRAATKLSQILKPAKPKVTIEDDHWMTEITKKALQDDLERISKAFTANKLGIKP